MNTYFKSLLLPAAMAVFTACDPSAQQDEELITVDVSKSYPKKELILQDFMDKKPIANLVDEIFDLTVFNNDEIAFAWRIEAPEIIEAYEAGKLKGKLKEIAAGMHEEDNPVLMLAKYKQH